MWFNSTLCSLLYALCTLYAMRYALCAMLFVLCEI